MFNDLWLQAELRSAPVSGALSPWQLPALLADQYVFFYYVLKHLSLHWFFKCILLFVMKQKPNEGDASNQNWVIAIVLFTSPPPLFAFSKVLTNWHATVGRLCSIHPSPVEQNLLNVKTCAPASMIVIIQVFTVYYLSAQTMIMAPDFIFMLIVQLIVQQNGWASDVWFLFFSQFFIPATVRTYVLLVPTSPRSGAWVSMRYETLHKHETSLHTELLWSEEP